MTGVRALGNCIGTSSSATERLGDVASSRRSPTRSRDSTNRFSGVHKHRAPRLLGERSNSKHDDAAKHKRKVSTGKITHDAHLVFAKDALYHEATCKLRYGPQHPGMRAEHPFEKISMDPNSNHRALSMDTTLGGRHQADQIRKVPTLRALDGHARCCAADRGSLQRQLEHRQLMQIEKNHQRCRPQGWHHCKVSYLPRTRLVIRPYSGHSKAHPATQMLPAKRMASIVSFARTSRNSQARMQLIQKKSKSPNSLVIDCQIGVIFHQVLQ
jgi:hypothetical protein